MSFDDQIIKQQRILEHIKNNLANMNQNELRDYSQEFHRCDRIINHMLRGYNNPAGRYLSTMLFTSISVAIILVRTPISQSIFKSFTPQNLGLIAASTMLGWVYAGRFHGNNSEYKRLLGIYDVNSKPLIEEFNKIFEKL
jgi:hypothetical protein